MRYIIKVLLALVICDNFVPQLATDRGKKRKENNHELTNTLSSSKALWSFLDLLQHKSLMKYLSDLRRPSSERMTRIK